MGWQNARQWHAIGFIDPTGVKASCVISAALWTHSSNPPYLPHCGRILRGNASEATALFLPTQKESTLKKIVIVTAATLALVTAAGAADLPRKQPVYQEAPVGKMPIGKSPIGKSPIGKGPVVHY
jgi:hypothetical protein